MISSTMKADKYDSVVLKVDSMNVSSLVVTAAARLNDCDFKERVLKVGDEMEIKYPAAAYIVLRALQDEANFVLSYKFINRDPADYEKKI